METKAEVLSRIKALSQSVIESEENANNLVDLLGYLQVAKFIPKNIHMITHTSLCNLSYQCTHPHCRNTLKECIQSNESADCLSLLSV